MENFNLTMFGYTMNPNSIRKDIREDLVQNLGIKAVNGEKGKKGQLIVTPTKEWTKEKIVNYLEPRHNHHFPGVGYYGFELE